MQALLKSGAAVAELAAAGKGILSEFGAPGSGGGGGGDRAATKRHLQEMFQVSLCVLCVFHCALSSSVSRLPHALCRLPVGRFASAHMPSACRLKHIHTLPHT